MSTSGSPQAPPRAIALSILVPTLDRLASLRDLLAQLAACSCHEPYEVVVIDNGSEPPLSRAALETPGIPALRLLRESQRGKSHALNRALDEGGLGEIVAVLDDDMSPAADWIEGVLNSTRRLPQFDIFSGKSHVVWPAGVARPPWTCESLSVGMQFSAFDSGSMDDVEFGIGSPRFPPGNHFWFRRKVLDAGARFPNVWITEPEFVVRLGVAGHRGMFVPDVVIGHRIQKELVDPRQFWARARRFGREMAALDTSLTADAHRGPLARLRAWLRPGRALVEFCGWSCAWLWAGLRPESKRIPARARALWGLEYCRARLRPSLGKAHGRDSAGDGAAVRLRGSDA